MRTVALALAVSAAVAAAACTAPEPASCPGTPVADFRLEGLLVPKDDPRYTLLRALDPDENLPDCTPDPADTAAPIRYPPALPAFDARLSADPATDGAALCRPNGSVLSGTRSGARYEVEADADSAILCGSVCSAALRVVVKGDLAVDAGGAPVSFDGILVEVLTEARGTCEACLPSVPEPSPPLRACAARYALTGTPY